jgi:hypothetical protein
MHIQERFPEQYQKCMTELNQVLKIVADKYLNIEHLQLLARYICSSCFPDSSFGSSSSLLDRAFSTPTPLFLLLCLCKLKGEYKYSGL